MLFGFVEVLKTAENDNLCEWLLKPIVYSFTESEKREKNNRGQMRISLRHTQISHGDRKPKPTEMQQM